MLFNFPSIDSIGLIINCISLIIQRINRLINGPGRAPGPAPGRVGWEGTPRRDLARGNGSLASVFGADDCPETPPYHVEDAYWTTGINQAIARSNHFANITVGVVVFNAVYIGRAFYYGNLKGNYCPAF